MIRFTQTTSATLDQVKGLANALAWAVAELGGPTTTFPDGAERLAGAETQISDDRTILVVRQYQIQNDTFAVSIRLHGDESKT